MVEHLDVDVDSAREEYALIEAEALRRRWVRDPVLWVREALGEWVWSKQQQIMHSVRDKRRTAVPSCHGAGKSFIAARVAGWWLSVHPPGTARVITSATTGAQVKAVLWNEIGQMHAKGNLGGRTNQTEWLFDVNGKEYLAGIGRKPSEYNTSGFQGMHARYVLVIFDEAGGIPGGSTENPNSLWESGDSLLSNDDCRFLAIGNPDVPDGEFADICKPGSGWNVIGIDAFETPNFTDEEVPDELRHVLIGRTWVEEKRKKWGETNPLWVAKVRGKFPDIAKDGLIPISWIVAAQGRDLEPRTEDELEAAKSWPCELGVDVGGGGDKNVVAHRRGPIVRIRRRDKVPNTMESCGNLIQDIEATGAEVAKVDEVGIGRGLVERAQEQGHPVRGVNVGREAKDKTHYANVRAEGYYHLRDQFQNGTVDLDPADDDLAAQLVDIKFKPLSTGKIIIESKDEMKRRGKDSPDDADAVMLSFLPEELCGPSPVREVEVAWG